MRKRYSSGFLNVNIFFALILTALVNVNLLRAQILYPEQHTVIGPSPQAAAFTIYGDYPVSYNTGMVDMRVPIYTIKSGALTFPIDISFHASGRMANEKDGALGMRWVLNAGGVITRTVRGYPDEWDELTPYDVPQSPGGDIYQEIDWVYSNWEAPEQSTDQEWVMNWLYSNADVDAPTFDELYYSNTESYYSYSNEKRHIGTYYDSEFDIFRYQLPSGKSGKFILKNENGTKKVFTIPYEPLDIKFEKGSNNEGLYVSISITDIDGTIYNYGGGNRYEYYDDTNFDPEPLPNRIPTAWYLESIVSADKQDTIQLSYQDIDEPNGTYQESIAIGDRIRDNSFSVFYDPNIGEDLTPIQTLKYPGKSRSGYESVFSLSVPQLTSIDFKQGNFAITYNGYVFPTLDEMLLTGDITKKFKFNIGSFPDDPAIRHLKDLEVLSISDNIETVEQKYSFEYYKVNYGYLKTPKSKDWWGYYNDRVIVEGNWGMSLFYQHVKYLYGGLSKITFDIGNSGNDNSINSTRNPDFDSMKSGMLKSISYPTGGTTEFEYEHNYYEDEGLKTRGPGLRISKITNNPIQGNKIVKTFKYGELNGDDIEDGMGYINPELKPYGVSTFDVTIFMSL